MTPTKPPSEAEVVEAMHVRYGITGYMREALTAARALGVLMPDEAAGLRKERDIQAEAASICRAYEKAALRERDALAARLKVAEDALRDAFTMRVTCHPEWEAIARAALTPPPEAKDAAA